MNKWDFLDLPEGVTPTTEFDYYWRWIYERHRIFERRLAGLPVESPTDKFQEILASRSFCNPFRVLDFGSQFVVYMQNNPIWFNGGWAIKNDPVEVFFRVALYRAFNSPETFHGLVDALDETPTWAHYDFDGYCKALGEVEIDNGTLYRGAYMFNDGLMFGGNKSGAPLDRKYKGSVRLIQRLVEDGVAERVAKAETTEEIFLALSNGGKYAAFSDGFLAMQLAVDLAYSSTNAANEDDFWPIRGGNGYGTGMKFCFGERFNITKSKDLDLMARIVWRLWERQDRCFETVGYPPVRLLGHRELKPIDLENSFCETSKILKELQGGSKSPRLYKGGRGQLAPVNLPPKWGMKAENFAESKSLV